MTLSQEIAKLKKIIKNIPITALSLEGFHFMSNEHFRAGLDMMKLKWSLWYPFWELQLNTSNTSTFKTFGSRI